MDVLAVDGLLDNLADAEGGIPGRVKILGLDVERALGLAPLIDLMKLFQKNSTT